MVRLCSWNDTNFKNSFIPDGPVVTHGMTLTSKIPLKEVLTVIKVCD